MTQLYQLPWCPNPSPYGPLISGSKIWEVIVELRTKACCQTSQTSALALIPTLLFLQSRYPPYKDKCRAVMNDISILVLKTQELSPSSQKMDQTLQESPGPANLLSHRLKLMNYSATRRPTTENSLNSCQSAAKLVPMKTHTDKGNVTWLTEVGKGPTANLPRANTGASESTLEALESNPDPPKTTQVTQSVQEPAHLLNYIPELTSHSKTHQSPKDNSPNGHQIDANLEPPKTQTYAEVVACLKEVKKNLFLTLLMTTSNCQPSTRKG
ncbi:hypothetical protein DSO57_1010937 [Entomophthora muscae]|uniref:Uncharacterized protein n=1 Tax=Entomophthora muscae TaxID=34485 RepID=A0ACC2SVI7_9FUNG|nr:hypothetical protein DSO57_1010937 [Entomophthora muscae]